MSSINVKCGEAVPFEVPDYDLKSVQTIAKATDLSAYYDNLLDDAFDRDVEDFTYGVSPRITKRLIARLVDGFSWTEWRDKLQNMGDHHKVTISGIPDQGSIDVHYIHKRSDNPKAIPLLLVHGWPGSVLEFHKIAPMLAKNYNVVMPSIPGFAFSGVPRKSKDAPGGYPWDYEKTAACFNELMQSLGYKTYVTQGGDWGSMITRYIAQTYPDNVKAVHVNYFSASTSKPDSVSESELSDLEKRGLERLAGFRRKGCAYQEIQGTTPYTLGGALACSPIAVIIYIAEKVFRWSSPDTHPSDDEVLANCLLYYFTGSVTSSFWLYYFRRSGDNEQAEKLESRTFAQPVSFGCGPYEIFWPVKKVFVDQIPKLRSWQVLEKGGHFLAWEAPETLAKDIDAAFQSEEVQKMFN